MKLAAPPIGTDADGPMFLPVGPACGGDEEVGVEEDGDEEVGDVEDGGGEDESVGATGVVLTV